MESAIQENKKAYVDNKIEKLGIRGSDQRIQIFIGRVLRINSRENARKETAKETKQESFPGFQDWKKQINKKLTLKICNNKIREHWSIKRKYSKSFQETKTHNQSKF